MCIVMLYSTFIQAVTKLLASLTDSAGRDAIGTTTTGIATATGALPELTAELALNAADSAQLRQTLDKQQESALQYARMRNYYEYGYHITPPAPAAAATITDSSGNSVFTFAQVGE